MSNEEKCVFATNLWSFWRSRKATERENKIESASRKKLINKKALPMLPHSVCLTISSYTHHCLILYSMPKP
jgi:hypothetical protein